MPGSTAVLLRCLAILLGGGALTAAQEEPEQPRPVASFRVERMECIHRGDRHAAFPDLIRFEGALWCAFRQGSGHVPGRDGTDGTIRVLRSERGWDWKSVGELSVEGIDLRDPKLSETPDGRLMVLMGGSNYEGERLVDRVCRVSFWDGEDERFTEPEPIQIDASIRTDEDWLWRVTWRGDTGYGAVYQPADEEWGIHLVATGDGIRYRSITPWALDGRPNETTLRFLDDGRMIALVRREGGDRTGRLGISPPPYREWEWKPLPVRLGGPNLLALPGGNWLVATRAYTAEGARTALARLTLDGEYSELLQLPSGGDTSYPGLVFEEDRLWVAYYSSHEGPTSIYLAELRPEPAR